jgi:hypothetical protein
MREIEVDAKRMLAIHGSYSADTIAEKQHTVRRPFNFEGNLFVSIGGTGLAGKHLEERCYMIIPKAQFQGTTKYYGQSLCPEAKPRKAGDFDEDWAEERRKQPNGFYHGMLIKRGKAEWVLVGPEVVFRPKNGSQPIEPKQLTLF